MQRLRRSGKFNLLIVLILVLSMCCGTVMAGYTATEEEVKEAQQAAEEAKKATEAKRAEAKEVAKKAAEAVENIEAAETELEKLQQMMDATRAMIEATRAQINVIRAEIGDTLDKIAKKEREIEEQNTALDNRLVAMYKTGSAGFIDVLLSSESVGDLLTNADMVQKILASDQKLLQKLKKDFEELKEIKQQLEEKKAEMEAQEAYLEGQEIDLESQELETEELKKKFQAEADRLKAMEDQLEEEAKALAADAAAKQAAAEAMIVDNGGETETPVGEYAWPTKGNWKITSNYGWRICPFHGREFHNGIDIVLTSGTYGSPVYAVADGMITRASWYSSYGNCIQLASGGGISTLYGHLSGYNCSAGQFVKKGTVIGYIGSTGNSTGPHLHFSVYKNGTMQNPFSLY